ncbi:hypothetical protein BDZ90DRAFT_152276 [Jaminaea rosea]|uniref:Uncharacterized protein n=1 Tax=Jaminaea rosea TaxID=1569628 RepID=A0A316UZI5_9BASI|nr:hypothetical protein BDZ90DRAFT_152276 [Jaminaea rosea]PWN28585.1 hypothetical protein BDZ90DRAFT_152276 [Jaminaea rosea]
MMTAAASPRSPAASPRVHTSSSTEQSPFLNHFNFPSSSSSSVSSSSSSRRAQHVSFSSSSSSSSPAHWSTTSPDSVDGWWEHVLPQGPLADRLRRAHHEPHRSPSSSTIGRSSASVRSSPKAARNVFAFPGQASRRHHADGDDDSSDNEHAAAPRKSQAAKLLAEEMGTSGSGGGRRRNRQRVQSADGPSTSRSLSELSQHNPVHMQQLHPPAPHLRPRAHRHSVMPACPSTGSSGHFSPLSRTPEISSGSETEYAPTSTTTSASSTLSRSQSLQINSGRAARSKKSTTFSDQEWQDVLSGRHYKKRSSRRVSFDAEAEAKARSDEENEDELRKLRLLHQQQQHQQHKHQSQPHSQHRNPLDELAASGSQHWFNTTSSATIHRRRTRTLSRDGFGIANPSSSRRAGTGSAPVSPRTSMHLSDAQRAKLLDGLGIEGSGLASHQHSPAVSPPLPSSSSSRPPRYVPAPASQHEVAVLRSLQSAQHHITRTTSTALSYSRSLLHLPAPVVRPLMQATLIWWISSATLFALGTCLLASYCLTVWDDVNGKKRSAEAQWGKKRGATRQEEEDDSHSASTSTYASPSATPSASRRASAANALALVEEVGKVVFISPLHFAAKVPLAVAYSLAPRAVPTGSSPSSNGSSSSTTPTKERSRSGSLVAAEGDAAEDATDSQQNEERQRRYKDAKDRPLPPRPPLSSLIPSMFFTLLLALGAGLFGGWVKKHSKGNGEGEEKGQQEQQEEGQQETRSCAQGAAQGHAMGQQGKRISLVVA